ncbi:PIG-L deacetylase family protein [Variovorax sp. LT1R16]|uniref:PIG-L deacetylase family protein n=1 Tax=Variovorax sp. LT1R16 TaxID=3443728 RepID=UPI003F471FB8
MAAVAERAIEGQGTTEAEWLPWLAHQPMVETSAGQLVPPGYRAVVVAPHPDDEVLAVGGLLAQLQMLRRSMLIVAATDGTASHPASMVWPPHRLAVERPLESHRAWQALGLDVDRTTEARRLGFDDGGLMRQRGPLARALAALLRPRDVIFTTWRYDGHPDHEATAQACAAAAADTGARLIEVPVWAWHWAAPGDARLPWSRAVRLALDADAARAKREAVGAFTSQLESDPSTGAGPILRGTTVQRAQRPFEVFFS